MRLYVMPVPASERVAGVESYEQGIDNSRALLPGITACVWLFARLALVHGLPTLYRPRGLLRGGRTQGALEPPGIKFHQNKSCIDIACLLIMPKAYTAVIRNRFLGEITPANWNRLGRNFTWRRRVTLPCKFWCHPPNTHKMAVKCRILRTFLRHPSAYIAVVRLATTAAFLS